MGVTYVVIKTLSRALQTKTMLSMILAPSCMNIIVELRFDYLSTILITLTVLPPHTGSSSLFNQQIRALIILRLVYHRCIVIIDLLL